MNYGKAIKIVRTAHGLTQAELTERLSIGPSHLSLIEAGRRQPSLRVLGENLGRPRRATAPPDVALIWSGRRSKHTPTRSR